ncbi:MAG: uncharacterized protein A8A55_1755 [Amphiamblys sp. WSBS2006]|nr:MAG: uncharacterized protein A8A55_1755 [Amphiamblys sp. WSBS2006]
MRDITEPADVTRAETTAESINAVETPDMPMEEVTNETAVITEKRGAPDNVFDTENTLDLDREVAALLAAETEAREAIDRRDKEKACSLLEQKTKTSELEATYRAGRVYSAHSTDTFHHVFYSGPDIFQKIHSVLTVNGVVECTIPLKRGRSTRS